jgi:GNAT superfamily N-acetyltransferase
VFLFSEATVTDVPTIVDLVNRAYSPLPGAPGWAGERSFQPGDRTDAAEVTRLVTAPESVVLLGRRDGVLVSCCSVARRSGDAAYLGLFGVDPDRQSGGAGRATMQFGESFARSRFGASRMEIEVMEHHGPLRRWYERIGYAVAGERSPFPGSADGRGAWLIPMAKALHED